MTVNKPVCEELVQQVLSGDHEAFAELHHRYHRYLYRQVARLVGTSDADEAVQETFCAAFKSLPSFQAKASFATWITRIAINIALQVLRRRHRRLKHQVETLPVNVPCQGPDIEAQVASRSILPWLEQAVGGLPPRQREVFILCALQNFSPARAARILNVKIARVKGRLHAARVKLRQDYQESGLALEREF